MNERLPDDELVSSVLDGEADPTQRALVEGDPALQQRLASFRHVASSLGSAPVAASPEMCDQAVAAALAAFPAVGSPEGADVIPLTRPARSPWLLAAAAVAALVVLLPMGILVVDYLGDGSSGSGEVATGIEEPDDTVSVTPRSTTPTTGSSDGSDGADPSGGGSDSDGRTPGPRRGVVAHLGELSDTTAVAAAIASYTSSSGNASSGTQGPTSPGGNPTPSPPDSSPVEPSQPAPSEPMPSVPGSTDPVGPIAPADTPCPEVVSNSEPVELVVEASYQGVPSMIVVTSTDTDRSAVVVDSANCQVLAEVPL